MIRFPFLLAPFLALACLAQAPSRVETRQEPLPMGARLWVIQVDGDVDCQGWDKPQVEVTAEFRDSPTGARATLEIRKVAEGLEVEVKCPMRRHWALSEWIFGNRNPRCDLHLMVPRKLAAAIRAVDGSVRVRDLEGYARCETVDGRIILDRVQGEVYAKAVDGRIEARDLKARISGGTVDGSITLERVEGGIHMKTVDGHIRAESLDGWGEGIELSTVDGSIDVTLGQAKGILEASTADGRLVVESPGAVITERHHHEVRGTVPGREQPLKFHTVDGSIRIH
jgi:hypothetical protein